jgi:hypothetical protein
VTSSLLTNGKSKSHASCLEATASLLCRARCELQQRPQGRFGCL